MLNEAKLNAMPIEVLEAIQRQITRVIASRSRLALKVGGLATFFSAKKGYQVTLMIEKFNPKSIGGYEVKDGVHLFAVKWRVHPSFLTPVAPVANQPVSLLSPSRARSALWSTKKTSGLCTSGQTKTALTLELQAR